jgi:hypothetical protein
MKKRPQHRYTPEEIQFLKDNYEGKDNNYACVTEMFNRRFGLSLRVEQIRYLIRKKRLRSGFIKPIAAENLTTNGYTFVKTGSVKGGGWEVKHRVIWEAANGPIPPRHVVIFLDGDKSNFNTDNLALVPKGVAAVMSRFRLFFPNKDLTKAGKSLAELKLLIAERSGKDKKEAGK